MVDVSEWWRSPIVWWTVVFFGDELVITLNREVQGRCSDADGSQDEDGPTSGAERPGKVEVPPLPEAVIVVE